MADADKVTIQIDLDSGQFASQLSNVKQQSSNTFSEMSMGVIGVNQALEIGQKAFDRSQGSGNTGIYRRKRYIHTQRNLDGYLHRDSA